MPESKRLVGEDGMLYKKLFGTALIGNGTSDLDTLGGGGVGSGEGWYRITAKANTSAFPGVLNVNDEFWTAGTIIPQVGDDCKKVTEVEVLGLEEWNVNVNRAEIEVTTQSDTVKKYRTSKKCDISGSLKGIREINEEMSQNEILNKFFRMVIINADGTVDVKQIDDSNMYLKGYTVTTDVPGEVEEFIDMEVKLTSFSYKQALSAKQEISCNFRPAGETIPTIYQRRVA